MRYGSLFAGVGGFDSGFDEAGLECAWQVECDKDCLSVLARHWSDVPRFTDVRTVGKHNLPPVDVICGGFPCQDVSVAGKRAGISAERSGLFYEMTRVVHELQPRILVWENVPGLLTSDQGRDFARVLLELGRIGFHGCWTTLDAQHFGLAQRRRRVFGVFTRGDIGAECAAEILALWPRSRWNPAASSKEGPATAACLRSRSHGPGVNPLGRGGEDDTNLIVGPVTSGMSKGPRGSEAVDSNWLVTHALRSEGCDASEDGTGRGTPIIAFQCHGNNVGPMGAVRSGNGGLTGGVPFIVNAAESCAKESHARETDIARCLDQTGGFASSQGGTVIAFDKYNQAETGDVGCTLGAGSRQHNNAHTPQVVQAVSWRGRGMEIGNEVANAIRSGGEGHICDQMGYVKTGMMVRRLTPRECERLQGFLDDWTLLGHDGRVMSDSARYRMIGNAVPCSVARWLGKRIMVVLNA